MTDHPVTPLPEHGSEYLWHLPEDKDANEVVGFVLAGESGDDDVLFWSSAYSIQGPGVNQWVVPEARTNGTIFFTVPRDGEGMQDNNFVRRGLQISEFQGGDALSVDSNPDESSWEVAGRRYVWRAGEWEIQGEHAGVAADLRCRPAAPPLWTFGPFEDIAKNNFAGYDVGVLAEGTVTVGGKSYELRNAIGSHERACVGQGRDIMAELAAGQVFAGDCFADDVHLFFARHPGRPMNFGRLDVGDESVMYPSMEGQGEVHVTPLEHWQDPRSGMNIPSRWQVTMESPEANVDLEISYRGRAYWYYTTRSGVMVLMWLLGRANGTVHLASGETRTIENGLVVSRWGQTIFVNEESLNGHEFAVLRESM